MKAETNDAERKLVFGVWLKEAHALRSRIHEAEVDFFLHLIDGESGAIPWRGAYDSFGQLLKEEALADPGRYSSFRDSLGSVSTARARVIGVDATVIAARLPEGDKRETGVVAMEAWVRSHGHHPTRATATDIAKQIAPIIRLPRDLARELKAEDLRQENVALRRENTALRSELATAKKKIEKLEHKIAKK